jgi:hypothetical protein
MSVLLHFSTLDYGSFTGGSENRSTKHTAHANVTNITSKIQNGAQILYLFVYNG